jgi:hypothetical protein
MINSVRNSVLSVLNKNNYGYISPADFNLYAKQAQTELYEEYYGNYNKLVAAENKRQSGTDYADIKKTYEEILDGFLMSSFLQAPTSQINRFDAPSAATTGYDAYMINKLLVGFNPIIGTNTAIQLDALLDTTTNFVSLGILPGDFVFSSDTFDSAMVLQVYPSIIYLDKDIFQNIGQYFIFKSSTMNEAEKVTSGKISVLNSTPLTAPSIIFPAYVQSNTFLDVYPIIQNNTSMSYPMVQVTYLRYPKDPKWTYVSLAGGEPSFDQTQLDYQDFELPNEDEYKLVMKILQYCGISIRESEIVAFGVGQEQHEQPTFSQQQ